MPFSSSSPSRSLFCISRDLFNANFYVFDPLTTFPFAIQSKTSMSTPTRRLKRRRCLRLNVHFVTFCKKFMAPGSLSPISWRTTSSTCRPFPFIDLSASIIVSQNDRQMNQPHRRRSAILIRGTLRQSGKGTVPSTTVFVFPQSAAAGCCQTRFHSGVHHPKKSRQSPTINNVASLNLKVTAVMGASSRRRTLAFASRRHNSLTSYCNCYDMFKHHIMLPWFSSNLIFCVRTYTLTHTHSLFYTHLVLHTHAHCVISKLFHHLILHFSFASSFEEDEF